MSYPLDELQKPRMHEVLGIECLARRTLADAAEIGVIDAADGAAEAWGLVAQIFSGRLDEPYREAWPDQGAISEGAELEHDLLRVAPVGAFREFSIPFIPPLLRVAEATEAYKFVAPIPGDEPSDRHTGAGEAEGRL